ncbi:MAG: AraC family transcriptional regulator [Lachnospiraceae bacterium]|nr:AraC family transcriptional regulator [Lachnospiraceae bacterium]
MAKNQHTVKELEKRYQAEEQLMSCISRVDYEQAMKMVDGKEIPDPEQRTIDTLRDKKNYLIIINTLFRKAAQRAEVHPVYLDEISGKMAVRIEALNSVSQVPAMRREMIRRYCMLVRSNSTKGYSPAVQKVMNYIFVNLENDLSLQRIAAEFSMNKSYLSTLFKKEMGMTLTEYVNQTRIKRAIYLLNTEDMPIQEIAQWCGIPNLSYFTRIFKKEKNMTPSQYREMITKKTE